MAVRPSAVDRQRAGRRARRPPTATSWRPALRADDEPPAVHLVARPGPDRAGTSWWPTSGGIPARYSPFGVYLEGGDPGAIRGGRRRPGRRAGRGIPAGRDRAGDGPAGRPGRSAGWIWRPAPAARPACSARWRLERGADRGRRRDRSAPGRSGPADRRRAAGDRAHRGRPGSGPAAGRPTTGCCWTRRAPGWGRCAAGRRPAGAAQPSDVARLVQLQQELLDVGGQPGPARRAGRLRDLLAASGRDRSASIGRRPGAAGADRRPAVAAGCPGPRRRARPCSCGRTGTAPTACSWPCFAGDPDHAEARRTPVCHSPVRRARPVPIRRQSHPQQHR